MTFLFRWRWVGPIAAWLVLAMYCTIMPAEARAGCNHPWVKVGGSRADLFALAVVNPSGGPQVSQPGSVPRENPPSPCQGGACSRRPDQPVSWPPSVSSHGELWGDLPAGLPFLVPAVHHFSPERGLLATFLSRSLLERPPRTALPR